jgi:erythromycin esterase-like protein
MAETLEALMAYLQRRLRAPKVVVWAHNSHLGDARATEMSARGEWNVGQLVKARYGARAVSVGFTTYEGNVAAASDWDAPVEKKKVRPALPESYEALFHAAHPRDFLMVFKGAANLGGLLEPRLERAIGVIYRPDTERASHYFHASITGQFDAVIHMDRTHAVKPLERTTEWDSDTVPETYPFSV